MSTCRPAYLQSFQSGPLGKKHKRLPDCVSACKYLYAALLAFTLTVVSLGFSCPFSHAQQNVTFPSPKERPEEAVQQMDPSRWKLGPAAQHLYYYLLLTEGLMDNFSPAVDSSLKALLKLDPSLSTFQDSAGILLSRRDFSEAENIALQGLKRFPGDMLLTLLLAGVYSENGQTPKAFNLLEEHLKQHPDQREASEELIRLYLREGKREKAADLLTNIPAGEQTPEAVLFRAKTLSSLDRSSEALKLLRSLLEKEPDFYEAWLVIGRLYQQDKLLAEAAASFKKAAELSTDIPEIWFRIALIQIERKLPHEALEALDNLPPSPDVYIQAALRFADSHYFNEAETMLERAGKCGGNPDELALFLSVLRQESAKSPLAGLEPLESISSSSSLYPRALYQKARIYMQAKQYDKSFAIASDGRKRFPDVKELWGTEAYALVKLNQNAKAEKVLKKALERHLHDEDLLFTLGTVQDDANKKDEAIKTMEAIISVNPKNYQALNYVGYSLAEKNTNLQRALELITSALEQNPDADYIVDSLAWVYYRLGNLEEAWKNINRCISLGGDDPTMWEHYGDIAKATDRRDEAIKGYTESIARKPANIADVRKKLSQMQKK